MVVSETCSLINMHEGNSDRREWINENWHGMYSAIQAKRTNPSNADQIESNLFKQIQQYADWLRISMRKAITSHKRKYMELNFHEILTPQMQQGEDVAIGF